MTTTSATTLMVTPDLVAAIDSASSTDDSDDLTSEDVKGRSSEAGQPLEKLVLSLPPEEEGIADEVMLDSLGVPSEEDSSPSMGGNETKPLVPLSDRNQVREFNIKVAGNFPSFTVVLFMACRSRNTLQITYKKPDTFQSRLRPNTIANFPSYVDLFAGQRDPTRWAVLLSL